MQILDLAIPHAYVVTPDQHADERGVFLEWYRFDRLAEVVGHSLDLRQGNQSVSKAGVLRGIHFAQVPRGQAKYVTVTHGAVIDFIVDIRSGSPTFGRWDSVRLDSVDRRSVYLAEGLGHAFLSLEDDTVVNYLTSDIYTPGREFALVPSDPQIGLDVATASDLMISPKDAEAPTLEQALAAGLLPTWAECLDFYAHRDAGGS